MNNKRATKLNTNPSATTAPLNIFADQPSAVQVGPYVTKITLGVIEEGENEFPRPVVTVAMPTVNLMRMVNDLQAIFSDPEFKKESASALTADVKTYFGAPGTSKSKLPQQLVKQISKSDASK